MLRNLAITTLVLAAGLMGTVAQADIWRWKDPQGVFHYSDQWVPGSELIKASAIRPPGAEADSPRPTPGDPNKIAANANAQVQQQVTSRAVQEDLAKAREEQCKQAKDHYEKAIQARRIYKPGKDGEREYVTDAEAETYRQQARSEMEQACAQVNK